MPERLRNRFMHYMTRSRYAEECLAEAVRQRRLGQYVILGGGLETFPYRQPDWAGTLRIFEVDHPVTQTWKRRRLAAAGIAEPPNVQFVPVDFDVTTLEDGLAKAGVVPSAPTFFSMLGVSQYLTPEALDHTFRFVRGMPRGSEIAFTVAVPDEMLEPDYVDFTAALMKRFAEIGEPWLTRLRPDALADRLREMGFSAVEWLSAAACNDRYFRDGLRASEQELPMRAVV